MLAIEKQGAKIVLFKDDSEADCYAMRLSFGVEIVPPVCSGLSLLAYPQEIEVFLRDGIASLLKHCANDNPLATAADEVSQSGRHAVMAIALGFSNGAELDQHEFFLHAHGSSAYKVWRQGLAA